MTTVFHQNVNTVVPWTAQYAFPSQATNTNKSVVKVQPLGGTSYSPSNRRIQFQLPSDGYLNAMNSAISWKFQITGQELSSSNLSVLSYDAVAVAARTGSGAASTTTLTIAGGTIAPEPASLAAGAFIGWHVMFTDGPVGGDSSQQAHKFQISEHTVADASHTLVFKDTNRSVVAGTYAVRLYPKLAQLQRGGAHELIKRIRVLYGGVTLEDIPEYNRLARMLLETGASAQYMGTAGNILDGTGSSVLREASNIGQYTPLSASTSDTEMLRPYEHATRQVFNLYNGLMRCQKLIPLKWMAASLVLEVELADAADCLICNSSAVSYQLTDVCYIAELLQFDQLYDATLYQGMQMMGVPLKFTSWHHQERTITGTGHYQIHERARSVKAVLAVAADTLTHIGKDSHLMYHDLGKNVTAAGAFQVGTAATIQEFQFRIGGKYFPSQPVNCEYGAAEAYFELLKTLNTLGDIGFASGMQRRDWASTGVRNSTDDSGMKFVIACELENTDVFPSTIAGINAENQSDLTIALKVGGVPVNKRMHVFTSFDNLMIVREGHYVEHVM